MPANCCKDFWARIPEDEPVFILAGRDETSAEFVEAWIKNAEMLGVNADKIARARLHLDAIRTFQANYPERCKLPD
jgi:hypothetical protein